MKEELKIVVIGGVAGGATAATRARRTNENAEITLVERGSAISFANCGMPYYISGDITDRARLLLQTPQSMWDQYRIRVLTLTTALHIDREKKIVQTEGPGGTQNLSYDKLILSQGGEPILPGLPGLPAPHAFSLRGLDDMDSIDSWIREKSPRNAVIVGGGFIGIEMAEALHRRGLHVTIVEKAPHVMPQLDRDMIGMVTSTLVRHGIEVHTDRAVVSVESAGVILDDGNRLPAEMILFSIGVRPEILLAKECGLLLGSTGGVLVNAQLQSSDPDIYVVGDMAEISHKISGRRVRIPLAGPANRQGRVAGSNAGGETMVYHGGLGSAIVKIFDRVLASTGLTETQAHTLGLDASAVTVHGKNHAGYYPGSADLSLKLVFLSSTGELIGAQAFGSEGVDKRIDTLAAAIRGGLTVEDLEDLDLAYAPPFSSANDPINIAGFTAMNRLRGFSPSESVLEFADRQADRSAALLLDVRNAHEFAAGHLTGALNIPLPELRARVSELPPGREILVYCQVGRRGHLAVRILLSAGLRARNVSGGFQSLQYVVPHLVAKAS